MSYRPGAIVVKDSKKCDYIYVVMSVSTENLQQYGSILSVYRCMPQGRYNKGQKLVGHFLKIRNFV